MNFNRILFGGHLTRDVELKTTTGGTVLAKFGMASNHKYKDKESVCFVDLVAWGKQAETLAKYLRKGDPLFVEGRLDYSTWKAPDGSSRSKLEVVVEGFQFLGKGKDSAPGSGVAF